MNYYIGIDPGKDGGVSVINQEGEIVNIIDMPLSPDRQVNSLELKELISSTSILAHSTDGKVRAIIERAQGMPGQGVNGTFNYGVDYGRVLSVLEVAKVPYQTVTPGTWKKHFQLLKKNKKASCSTALRLFPGADIRGPQGGWRDGRAESLLLVEYLRRKMRGEDEKK